MKTATTPRTTNRSFLAGLLSLTTALGKIKSRSQSTALVPWRALTFYAQILAYRAPTTTARGKTDSRSQPNAITFPILELGRLAEGDTSTFHVTVPICVANCTWTDRRVRTKKKVCEVLSCTSRSLPKTASIRVVAYVRSVIKCHNLMTPKCAMTPIPVRKSNRNPRNKRRPHILRHTPRVVRWLRHDVRQLEHVREQKHGA